MTSYPGCVTPTEIDPNPTGWAEKPICGPTVHPFIVRRLGEIVTVQTFFTTGTKLKVSLGGLSAQTYYSSGTPLKIRRVM